MLILNALLRGGIPLVVMGGIALILHYQGKYSDAKSTFLVSIIVFFVAAASVIYDIEQWSLLRRSAIHFLIMLITIYPILLVSDWFEISSFFDALKVFGLFLLVGIVLWSFFWMVIKIFSK